MKFSTTALALVLAATSTGALAQYGSSAPQQTPSVPAAQAQQSTEPAKPAVRPSSKAMKAIVDLQNTVNKNDVANIPAKLAAAKAVATTKEDNFIIGEIALKAALAANDTAAAASAIDTIAASNYLDAAAVAGMYRSLGGTYYNAKDYDHAAAAYQRAMSINPNDMQAALQLGETRNAQGRAGDAVAAFQHAISLASTSGRKPPEEAYKRAVAIAYNAQLPAATELGRQWAAAYPSAESWRNSIAIFRNQSHQDVEGTLDLLRLMQAAGALTTAGDYNLFVESAADQSNYTEAQAVLNAGLAAKVLDASNPQVRDEIAALKAKPIATSADLEAATKDATTGTALVRIGDRYFGLGQYSKAAELYRQALGKPGVDAATANLHLGMALARSGDKAGAKAALTAVTGARADVAKFWLAYLQNVG